MEKDSFSSLLLQALGFDSVFYHAFNLLHLFPSPPPPLSAAVSGCVSM